MVVIFATIPTSAIPDSAEYYLEDYLYDNYDYDYSGPTNPGTYVRKY